MTIPQHTDGRQTTVLLLVTTLTYGGAETQVVQLALGLKARGIAVSVVCLVKPKTHVALLEQSGIDVYWLNMTRGVPEPGAVYRLRTLIRRLQPDVVHCHMFHANLLGRVTRLITHIPVLVSTIHNLKERSEKGGPTWHKELLYQATDRLSTRTTAICRAALVRHVERGAISPQRALVVPNGVDTTAFRPDPISRTNRDNSQKTEGVFVWLAVGRLVAQKDYPNLLRAAASLSRTSRWHLCVVGKGPLEAELRTLAGDLGIDSRVSYLGTYDEMAPVYTKAHAFVMSSEYEGLSAALLEASACGLPAVVTDAGGNTDIVLDGLTGYVVPPRDSVRLGAAMQRLMDMRPDRRGAFGSAARSHILANFSLDSVIAQWATLYRTVLSVPAAINSAATQSATARVNASPAKAPIIMYLITRAERGGAQVHLRDVIANLPRSLQPLLVTGEEGYLTEEAAAAGMPVRIVPSLKQPISVISDARALLAIARLIRIERPALVHAHTSKAGLLGRLAGRWTHTPVVFTAHTWSYADGCPRLQKLISVPLERFAARMGGPTLTVSLTNTRMALNRFVVRPSDMFTVWNGIPDVAERAHPGGNPSVTFTMVARFAKQKDHATILAAAAGLQGNFRLLLVGDGPTRPAMETLSRSLGLDDRVSFLGDRADTAEILARSDVAVLATKWEGLPLCILEAMRAGLPVVATKVGGCHEAVTDGETGYLTRSGDADHLRDRMQALANSKQLMSLLGANGRQRYERDFRLDIMMKRVLTVYKTISPELARVSA